ncbi:MAG: twin transmembrane helix small protein [Gammaproteobacteria bacterium]|nr:twin transmembrane helix small protein [Gammaproteobacteria bacterium]MBU2477940.1 twin transmembrane helix small protein [Gammaproteobacteria bacterium]
MLTKILIVLVLLAILGSLASGLIFLIKDNGSTERTVKALTVRIGLSVFLFLMLMLGIFTGVIKPHGINPYAATSNTTNSAAPTHSATQ